MRGIEAELYLSGFSVSGVSKAAKKWGQKMGTDLFSEKTSRKTEANSFSPPRPHPQKRPDSQEKTSLTLQLNSQAIH